MSTQIRWFHHPYNVMILLTQCILLPHIIIATTYGNINCISVEGLKSGPNEGDLSSSQCPLSYTMLSCGIRTSSITQKRIDGSFINNNNTCNAVNSDLSPDGIYAIARCCDFTPFDMNCNTYKSPESTTNDEDIQSQSCQSSSEELTGCTACTNTGNGTMDGVFPGSIIDYDNKNVLLSTENICTAKVGTQALSGLHSIATCCSSMNPNIQLQCKQIRGDASMTNVGAISSVQCPNNYFMTGCSAFSHWIISNQWEIDNNDTCIARTGAVSAENKKTTHSVAICCQLMVNTEVPTIAPTTINPTLSPSIMRTTMKAESEIDTYSTLIGTVSHINYGTDSQSGQYANIITIVVVLLLIICCTVTIICVVKSNYDSNKSDSEQAQFYLENKIDENKDKDLTVDEFKAKHESNKQTEIDVNGIFNGNNAINVGCTQSIFGLQLPHKQTEITSVNSASIEDDACSQSHASIDDDDIHIQKDNQFVTEGTDTYSNALPMTPGCIYETSFKKIESSILHQASQAYPNSIETTKGDNDCLDEVDKAYPEHVDTPNTDDNGEPL